MDGENKFGFADINADKMGFDCYIHLALFLVVRGGIAPQSTVRDKDEGGHRHA